MNLSPSLFLMDDLESLQIKLEILVECSDVISAHGRDLMVSATGDASTAMRQEIDQTQMFRRLVFRNDRDQTIALEVASGRVLKLSEPTSDQFTADRKGLLDQKLSENDKERIASLGAVLCEFTHLAKALFVKSQILELEHEAPSVGVPGFVLFQTCPSTDGAPDVRSDPHFLDGFLENCVPITTAIVRMDLGEITLAQGKDEHLHILKNLASRERASNAKDMDHQGDDVTHGHCVIMGGHPDTGQAVLCVSVLNSLAFVMFDAPETEKVFNFWISRGS